MSNLWINAGRYDDYDYSKSDDEQPQRYHSPSSGHQPPPMNGGGSCGNWSPAQEATLKDAVARDRNYADLGGGKKGWYCHECSNRNGYRSSDLMSKINPNPENEEWREPTPHEEISHGAVYHTSTPEGIKLLGPEHYGHEDTEAEGHPHVAADYGSEHGHKYQALYGIKDGGLQIWAD